MLSTAPPPTACAAAEHPSRSEYARHSIPGTVPRLRAGVRAIGGSPSSYPRTTDPPGRESPDRPEPASPNRRLVPMPPESRGLRPQASGDRILPPQHPPARPRVVATAGRPDAELLDQPHPSVQPVTQRPQALEELHVLAHEPVRAISGEFTERIHRAELVDPLCVSVPPPVSVPIPAQKPGAEASRRVVRRNGAPHMPTGYEQAHRCSDGFHR